MAVVTRKTLYDKGNSSDDEDDGIGEDDDAKDSDGEAIGDGRNYGENYRLLVMMWVIMLLAVKLLPSTVRIDYSIQLPWSPRASETILYCLISSTN